MELNCDGCPAFHLRNAGQLKKIRHWHSLFENEVAHIKEPKLIILCESYPQKRYIYDLKTSYNNRGLRNNLKVELYGIYISDEELIDHLREDKILILDCAYCPLFLILRNEDKLLAATLCLSRHNKKYLDQFSDTTIVSIFPKGRGFIKESLPDIQIRIKKGFSFNNIRGLRSFIESIIFKS